jgi:hypothetical protein
MTAHKVNTRPAFWRFFGFPSTGLGRWSLALLAGAAGLLILARSMAAGGATGGDTFLDNPPLAFSMLGAALCTLFAGGASGLAVFRRGERSLVSLLTFLLGLLVLVFLIGEIVIPH